MKKVCCIVIVLALVIAGLFICVSSGENSRLDEIGGILDLDVSGGTIVAEKDTHGGFHGDGTLFVSVQFADASIEDEIMNADDWEAFPISETVQTLVYGRELEDGTYGPYLADQEIEDLLPEIANGFYWLKDRQEADGELLYRPSFHFTVALYDSDTRCLYYCKVDT